ncbi:efflux transporter outer membrane subunit [Glaciimonas soli]|uniref:Efflux transporter outer membrane subunit n=1 Tax=Glaciimonas soli TaxID=2590999 RepID=A0A843YUC3_9BURK|nr:efflux transporter outer membrane subunit [Glaciimonas soli]MQR01304.1 efflux transporter outer membrane subunit [Glaciimonas soli]
MLDFSKPIITPRFAPRYLVGALLVAGVLSGCSMAPKYERPAAPIASAYPVESAQSDTAALGWRQFFPDQRLQALIQAALDNNRDLRTAALNIQAARAQYGITAADAYPNFNAGFGATKGRTPADQSPTGQSFVGTSYTVGLNMASYELDFFGRVRSLKDAALANYLSTEEARQTAQISLVSQVAQAYLAEQAYAEQQELAQQTLDSRLQDYKLIKMRFDVGASSGLDLRSSETLVQSARVALSTLVRQRGQATDALTLLVGKPIGELGDLPAAQTLASQQIVTDIPAGLPSDLLLRRPDIRSAEQQLLAANANIGVARAAFFPSISLTAGIGNSSLALGDLFSAGSRSWSFAPQITLPIFEGGRNRANLTLSEVRKNIAIANYEKTIQTAFSEVADALVARGPLNDQLVAQEAYLKAQEGVVALTDLQYKNGIASSNDIRTAQRDLFVAQQALIQTRQLRLNNAIDLYSALGGGLNEVTQKTN